MKSINYRHVVENCADETTNRASQPKCADTKLVIDAEGPSSELSPRSTLPCQSTSADE